MFDLIAVWFAAGMFLAGAWIVLGSFRPAPAGRRGVAGRYVRPARPNFSADKP